MAYEMTWLGWKAGKISDAEIISRMHVDPFFKEWFEKRRSELRETRDVAGDGLRH